MFRRIVSGSAIAPIGIAGGALVVLITPAAIQERINTLTVAWRFVPAEWGLWAMLAPVGLVPQRVPLWGAIMGLIAGLLAALVLILPSRISGETVPVILRGVAVVMNAMSYYFFGCWYGSLVALSGRPRPLRRPGAGFTA